MVVVGKAVQEFEELGGIGLDGARAIGAGPGDGDLSEATEGEEADPLPAAFEYQIHAGTGSESIFVIKCDDFHGSESLRSKR